MQFYSFFPQYLWQCSRKTIEYLACACIGTHAARCGNTGCLDICTRAQQEKYHFAYFKPPFLCALPREFIWESIYGRPMCGYSRGCTLVLARIPIVSHKYRRENKDEGETPESGSEAEISSESGQG